MIPGILGVGCHEVVVRADDARGRISAGFCGRLPGRQAERFGMDPAVVPGQDLGKAAGPVRDGAAADMAARDRQLGDGHWETVTGKRRELDLLIASMMPVR